MKSTSWLAACALLLACASHAWAQSAPLAQDVTTPPALSELQQCGVERVALQAQVVDLRAKVVELQTALDRIMLERERMRLEQGLQLPAGWQFDWQQLRPTPRTAPPAAGGQPQEPK